jgi:hypothetical protein
MFAGHDVDVIVPHVSQVWIPAVAGMTITQFDILSTPWVKTHGYNENE